MSTQDEVRISQLLAQVQNMQSKMSQFLQKRKITPGTNSVITYDENGLVVSSRSLQSHDIPELPISKIKGLEKMITRPYPEPELKHVEEPDSIIMQMLQDITVLKERIHQMDTDDRDSRDMMERTKEQQFKDVIDDHQDQINRIVTHLNNLPLPKNYDADIMQLQETVGILLERIEQQHQEITDLKQQLNRKANATQITPGIYTKMSVNRDGVITGWEPLTVQDLPKLSVNDVIDLQITLNAKSDQEFTTNLANTIATITAQLSHIAPTDQLQRDLDSKISIRDLEAMSQRITQSITNVRNQQEETDKKIHSIMQSINK